MCLEVANERDFESISIFIMDFVLPMYSSDMTTIQQICLSLPSLHDHRSSCWQYKNILGREKNNVVTKVMRQQCAQDVRRQHGDAQISSFFENFSEATRCQNKKKNPLAF